MCGLFGYALSKKSPYTNQQREVLFRLGAMGADKRGGQSYGTLHLDSKGLPVVKKGLGPLVGANFKELAESLTGYGHSRLATQGEINLRNSHPFEIGRIIGAHNGVLFNSSELDNLFGAKEVDSEHIFERIDQNDNLLNIAGYGIIQWYDKENPGKIFLCNIGDGELTLFELGGKDVGFGYFWTSEQEDGQLALAAAGISEYVAYDLIEGAVYQFNDGGSDLFVVDEMELKVQSRNNFTWTPKAVEDYKKSGGSLSIWDQAAHEEEWDGSAEDIARFFEAQKNNESDYLSKINDETNQFEDNEESIEGVYRVPNDL
jgi:glutamine phosphoribosylpyrophosphate amidotransferase